MEREIRDSLVSLRGSSAGDLAARYCRETVTDEIWEMMYAGLADIAFLSALNISDNRLAKSAAIIVVNSDSYDKSVVVRAKEFLEGKNEI